MAILKVEYVEETAQELRTMLDLWLKVKHYLQKAVSGEPITREDEGDFLRIKSDGTKYHRILKNKMTDQKTRIKKLDFNYDRMIDILRSSISIQHLRSLPEADMKRSMTEWHRIYVQLCNALGAYDFLRSDQVNLAKAAKRSGEPHGLIGKAKKALGDKRVLAGLAVLIVGGAAAAFFLGVFE
jgi:hypothetical protein